MPSPPGIWSLMTILPTAAPNTTRAFDFCENAVQIANIVCSNMAKMREGKRTEEARCTQGTLQEQTGLKEENDTGTPTWTEETASTHQFEETSPGVGP